VLPTNWRKKMTNATIAVDNGVNVEALLGAREALTAAPEAASFIWRAAAEWKGGTVTESSVQSFFGLGEEQRTDSALDKLSQLPNLLAALHQYFVAVLLHPRV
jgi:hypothetical protein